jgi:pyruvate formate lyase activating enzyme
MAGIGSNRTEEPPGGNAVSALIFNIMRFATRDGPGIRTSVFFKGCPLSCWWCHNPEGRRFSPDRLYFEERCRHCLDCAAECPQHAIREVDGAVCTSDACTLCGRCAEACMAEARQIAGRRYSLAELIAEVEKDIVFFDDSGGGVTLTGGEPLAQPEFAAAFLDLCRERGIRTTIETCGFAQPDTFRGVAHRADLVLFDLKLVDTEKHRQYTGVSNRPVFANLETLLASGRPAVVRVPLVPGINDGADDIAAFAAYFGHVRPQRIELLPFHRIGGDKYRRLGLDYKMSGTPPPAQADIERFRDTLVRAGLNVTVGD